METNTYQGSYHDENITREIQLSVIVPAGLMLALAGCAQPGHFTVGGWIESANEDRSGKANFGGDFNSCVGEEQTNHLTYHDRKSQLYPNLRLEGEVVQSEECIGLDTSADVMLACLACQGAFGDGNSETALGAAEIHYRSQNKRHEGGPGTAWICVSDGGEGANATAPDLLGIFITTGAYAGYLNFGEVQGNIQNIECDQEQGS